MLVGLPELEEELGDRFSVIQLSNSSPKMLASVRAWLRACALHAKAR